MRLSAGQGEVFAHNAKLPRLPAICDGAVSGETLADGVMFFFCS